MIAADALELPLRRGSAATVVTSPPYLGQRLYGPHEAEGGQQDNLADYVEWIVSVFAEVREVLDPRGTAWLNIGDKSNGSGGAGGDWSQKPKTSAMGEEWRAKKAGGPLKFRDRAYPQASFLDVPGAVVRGLILDGWRLRLPIVWNKGREAPEDLRHVLRPRWQHEMIFLLQPSTRFKRYRFYPSMLTETGSVWTFPPGGSGPAHLAPFPDEMARRCILPSTLPGDVVFDPFGGSGTVERVAAELGRFGVSTDLYAVENHGKR